MRGAFSDVVVGATSSPAGRIAGRSSTGPCARAASGSARRGSSLLPASAAVVVDPGRAFGTGAHPTTRACIELLARLDRGSLLDAGCGSGVVSVAAARLGFAPVVAVDVDEVAVEIARETARANGVEVHAFRADVLRRRAARARTCSSRTSSCDRRAAARARGVADRRDVRLLRGPRRHRNAAGTRSTAWSSRAGRRTSCAPRETCHKVCAAGH